MAANHAAGTRTSTCSDSSAMTAPQPLRQRARSRAPCRSTRLPAMPVTMMVEPASSRLAQQGEGPAHRQAPPRCRARRVLPTNRIVQLPGSSRFAIRKRFGRPCHVEQDQLRQHGEHDRQSFWIWRLHSPPALLA